MRVGWGEGGDEGRGGVLRLQRTAPIYQVQPGLQNVNLFLQLPGVIGLLCLQEDLSLTGDLPLHLNNLKERWGGAPSCRVGRTELSCIGIHPPRWAQIAPSTGEWSKAKLRLTPIL